MKQGRKNQIKTCEKKERMQRLGKKRKNRVIRASRTREHENKRENERGRRRNS